MDRNKVQEALKPITDGLFGKQRPVRYERPHFKVRPLVRMLQDLTSIPIEDMYAYAFSREPLNGKFDDGQRKSWMKQAVCCGREYAEKICCLYGVRIIGSYGAEGRVSHVSGKCRQGSVCRIPGTGQYKDLHGCCEEGAQIYRAS